VFDWGLFEANKRKKVLFVGGWLRDTTSFEAVESPYDRVVVRCPGTGMKYTGRLPTVDYMPPEEYEKELQQNLVYVDFVDTTTNNTILECIARSTPIFVRRHPSVVEHLGEGYPLYFGDPEEATAKLFDPCLISAAHEYLRGIDKSRFTVRSFVRQIVTSSIYRSIKCGG
jgi:hypothetical protein